MRAIAAILIAGLILACSAFPALASPENNQASQHEGPEFINLQFDGGTAADVANALTAAAGRPINFVFRLGAEEFGVPAIRLEQVALDTAIEVAMQSARDDSGGRLALNVIDPGDPGAPVLVIEPVHRDRPVAPAAPVRLTFDISDIASEAASQYTGIQMPMIATAIEQMLRLGDDNPPKIDYGFHPETGLMILRAPSDKAANEIHGVIDQLRLQAEKKMRSVAAERAVEISQMQSSIQVQLEELEPEVLEARERLSRGRREYQYFADLPEDDGPPEVDLEAGRERIAELEADYERLMGRYRPLKQYQHTLDQYADLLTGGAPPLTALSITEQYVDILKQ